MKASLTALAVWLATAAAATTAQQQYNVLYFLADDLRPVSKLPERRIRCQISLSYWLNHSMQEFLAAYDQKVMITPNIDKLASEALVFDKAYCNVAVCSPSRNSL